MLLENSVRNLIDSVGHGRMVEVRYRTMEHGNSAVTHTAKSVDDMGSSSAFEITVVMSCGCVAYITEIGLSIPSQWHNQPNDKVVSTFGRVTRDACTRVVNMTLFGEGEGS